MKSLQRGCNSARWLGLLFASWLGWANPGWAQSTWVPCADEHGICKAAGTHRVIYGTSVSGAHTMRVATDSITCDNAAFGGDPAVNSFKHCWYESSTWIQCAREGENCRFSSTRRVLYAAALTGATKIGTYAQNVLCDNSVFTDPAVNQHKYCWYESEGIPTYEVNANKPIVNGPINISANGQILENVHIVNHNGPCVVMNNKSNITIRYTEIGPCGDVSNVLGDQGIKILGGSNNLSIHHNVIHDASNLIGGNDVRGPVSIYNNLLYNVRGTSYEASAIQLGESRNHSGPIKIACNVIDDRLVTSYPMANGRQRRTEDHINLYNTGGTLAYPLEIAYNRIRGALDGWGGISGSGMQIGDSACAGGNDPCTSQTPGYVYVHHNIVYWVNGVGIAFAGGTTGNRVEYNFVDNRGSGPGPSNAAGQPQVYGKGTSDTGWAYAIKKYDAATSMSISYKGNLGNSYLWAWNNNGIQGPPTTNVFAVPGVAVTDQGGNNFQYTAAPLGTSLGSNTIWDLPIDPACL